MNSEYMFHKLAISDLPKGTGSKVITWTRGGRTTSSMRYRKEPYRIVFSFTRDNEPFEVSISLTDQPCNLGGYRKEFICPACLNNCRTLYIRKAFKCPTCYDVIYTSQTCDRDDRYLRIAQKIRKKLGASASVLEPFPIRPIGMHKRTYGRLHHVYQKALDIHFMLLAAKYGFMNKLFDQVPDMPDLPTEEDLWGEDYTPQGFEPGQVLPELERITP